MLSRCLKVAACCTGAALGLAPVTTPAPVEAAPYVEFEHNSIFWGSEFDRQDGTTSDLHVGYSGQSNNLSYYIQAGPSYSDSTGENELGVSGKGGFSVEVAEQVTVYGELGFRAEDDVDTNYTTKFGTRFTF